MMKKTIAMLTCALVCAISSGFQAHVSSAKIGDVWTYTLHNDEPNGSVFRPHAVFITLDMATDLTDITSPTGWDYETDHATYITWVFLENQPISVTPAAGQSLSGFGFTAAEANAVVAPVAVGAYDSNAMTEADDFVGATMGPATAPGGIVSGTLILEALDAQGQATPIPIQFRDSMTDVIVAIRMAYVAADGAFSVRAPDISGTYFMTAKPTTFLRERWLVMTSPAGFVITGTLLNGDVDGDNEITLVDFGQLASAFGSVEGDWNWLANADLDTDGEVNLIDYGVLSANFGEAGDD